MPTAITRGAMSARSFGLLGNTGDPYFSSVTLLLEAAAGGLTDLSSHAYTVTSHNNVATSATQSKFGGLSFSFLNGGSNNGYLTFSGSGAPLALGSGDFTVEGWKWISSAGGSDFLGSSVDTGTTTVLWRETGDPGIAAVKTDGTQIYRATDKSIGASAWHFFSFVRSSGTILTFVDGALSATQPSVATNFTATASAYVGAFIAGTGSGGDGALLGYMDQVRVTVGVARYTSAFTPPGAAFPTHS